ncbi:MAG TPA: HutD family protein [Xanthomonadaceae bacterium]|nr:HutD family protein [Xanthomonadaceae bacterium]
MQLPRALIEVIPANEYRRVRWRNGLGWTREIVRMPDHDTFDWRLSIAEIEQDAAFSAFPGVDRELVLLSGNGLRLRFGDGRMQELLPPHGSARFAGDEDVQGELVAGPTTDFNLMWRRDAIEASLWRRPLVGAMVVFVDPRETWAVHLLAGQARFADRSDAPILEVGDTALLRAGDERRRSVLDGAGEALLIRLAPRMETGPNALP